MLIISVHESLALKGPEQRDWVCCRLVVSELVSQFVIVFVLHIREESIQTVSGVTQSINSVQNIQTSISFRENIEMILQIKQNV